MAVFINWFWSAFEVNIFLISVKSKHNSTGSASKDSTPDRQ